MLQKPEGNASHLVSLSWDKGRMLIGSWKRLAAEGASFLSFRAKVQLRTVSIVIQIIESKLRSNNHETNAKDTTQQARTPETPNTKARRDSNAHSIAISDMKVQNRQRKS